VVSTTQAPWTPSGPSIGSGPAIIDAGNNIENIKKPKKIQIIVPYTVPQQTNALLEAEASGLRSHWHHREINHQFQESKIVNSPAEVTPAPVKATTHILASDLRNLLRNEQQKQQQQAHNTNLLKLQKNIDSWTAQEFSNPDVNNILDDRLKQATTAAAATLAPSKIIPNTFFATSPSYLGTTPRPSYFDHEASGSISHNVQAKIFSKGSVFKVTRPKAEELTTEAITTTDITTDYPTTTPEPTKTTSWEQVSLGFSKGTNEKVYVVTPMSIRHWTAVTTTTPQIPTSFSDVPSAKGYFVRSKAAVSKLQVMLFNLSLCG
jgi:hypothetical protein